MSNFGAAPDFAAGIKQSAFQVPGSANLSSQLDAQDTVDNAIQNDWSGVNSTLSQFAPQLAQLSAQAHGQNLTAGTETRMGQQNLATGALDSQSLGKALMQLGSKKSAGQAQAVGEAQGTQQVNAAQQATQLQQATEQARMKIYQSELDLQNQKFQMAQGVQKTKDGLQLANSQLTNLFNSLVANAKNAQDLGNIRTQRDSFNQTMMYIQAGLGAASTAAAGGAAAYGGAMTQAQNTANNAMVSQSDALQAQAYNTPGIVPLSSAANMPFDYSSAANTMPSDNLLANQTFYNIKPGLQ